MNILPFLLLLFFQGISNPGARITGSVATNDCIKSLDGTPFNLASAGGACGSGSGGLTVATHSNPSSVTPDAVSSNYQVITGQAQTLTINNPTGCTQGLPLFFRIKDAGSTETIAFDTQYRAINTTLPSATVASKTLYIGGRCNTTDTKIDVLAVGIESADLNYVFTDVANIFTADQTFDGGTTTGCPVLSAAGTTFTVDLAVGNCATATLPATAYTIAVTNNTLTSNHSKFFTLTLIQGGSGSNAVNWFTTIKWAGGSAPTLTTTTGKADKFTFEEYSTGNYYGTVAGQNF